jgi:excisionase family DNA binding protein
VNGDRKHGIHPDNPPAIPLLAEPVEAWLRELIRQELEGFFTARDGASSNGHAPAALLNVDELAVALKVPKSWIYDQTRRKTKNHIPHIRVGRYPRFVLSDVLAWLEVQKNS